MCIFLLSVLWGVTGPSRWRLRLFSAGVIWRFLVSSTSGSCCPTPREKGEDTNVCLLGWVVSYLGATSCPALGLYWASRQVVVDRLGWSTRWCHLIVFMCKKNLFFWQVCSTRLHNFLTVPNFQMKKCMYKQIYSQILVFSTLPLRFLSWGVFVLLSAVTWWPVKLQIVTAKSNISTLLPAPPDSQMNHSRVRTNISHLAWLLISLNYKY